MKNLITKISHDLIKGLIDSNDTVIDATCGNGYDTHLLASLAHHVYAFDIQENALLNAKKLNSMYNNITYILGSHENIYNYVDNAKGYVFNLGFLPNGKKEITTKADTTVKTLKMIINNLKDGDFILLVVYPFHEEGKKEDLKINELLESIDKRALDITRTNLLYKKNTPPYILLIRK